MVIDGINVWLNVPPEATAIVKSVVETIHNSSLM
jgi:hypothetical protein